MALAHLRNGPPQCVPREGEALELGEALHGGGEGALEPGVLRVELDQLIPQGRDGPPLISLHVPPGRGSGEEGSFDPSVL